jgi:predicted secreted protein
MAEYTSPATAVARVPSKIKGNAGRASMVTKMPNSGTRWKLKATRGQVANIAANATIRAETTQVGV